ncbi:MAG: sensor histidine kinase, partial [Caldilinea sp.]
ELARIVGEALRNAHRHGHARSAVVRFLRQDESAILTIHDDGDGFDPAQPPSTERKHFGLRVMAARAARLGGELTVHSAPGCGATIEVAWPLTTTLPPDAANERKR